MRNAQELPVQLTLGEHRLPRVDQLRQAALAITLAALLLMLAAIIALLFAASAYLAMWILGRWSPQLLLAAGALGFIAALAWEAWRLFPVPEE